VWIVLKERKIVIRGYSVLKLIRPLEVSAVWILLCMLDFIVELTSLLIALLIKKVSSLSWLIILKIYRTKLAI